MPTANKKMEVSIFNKDNEAFNDWLHDAISEAIIIIDKETRILYVNSQWEKITGYTLDEVRGYKLTDIEPGSLLNEVIRTSKPVFGKNNQLLAAKGVNIISNAMPVFHDNSLIGGIAIFRESSQIELIMKELFKMKRAIEYYQEQLNDKDCLPADFTALTGESKDFIRALVKAHKASESTATVLIEGESGVGKTLLARAIHMSSSRKEKPFVSVNCAAIPETLLESELFGYVRGAFTGANREGKMGKIEIANGGTLFLDEIADMSITMQSKILTVIQERTIERIGDNKKIPLDIRIIAATNKNLKSLVSGGKFREDLYFRLSVIPIYLLPLRERKEDIPLLINLFAKKYNLKYGKNVKLSKKALNILKSYEWPGNIRELDNVIEHAVVMCSAALIKPEDLPESFSQFPARYLSSLGNTSNEFPKLKNLLEEVEKQAIVSALNLTNYNKTKAMGLLGLSRRMFYHKIKKYGLNHIS